MSNDLAAPARALLLDSFTRVRELVVSLTMGLTPGEATFRPDADANTIAWLLWHLTRIQDDHVAELAGTEQVWTAQGWYERFGLPFDRAATGYGQTGGDVAAVRAEASLLDGYHADVHAMTTRYLDTVTAGELDRIVDHRWDPPVTAGVRLVSVLGDCMQHLGQAAYVRGIAARRH